MIDGFKTTHPRPQPIVHERFFNRHELKKALLHYMRSNGIDVPEGDISITWVNDSDRRYDHDGISLTIDEIPR